MPTIQVEGKGTIQAQEGQKLVLALEDNGVDILHRCGGNARCTTCRVAVIAGDAGLIGDAEAAILAAKEITDPNIRLSCQIRVRHDLSVKPVMTVSESGMDAGKRPID